MRVEFVRKTRMGHLSSPWVPWICPFWGGHKLHWLVDFSVYAQIEPKKWFVNYTTPFNLKEFHNVEFNLEFDETTAIGFITQFVF